MAAFPIPDSIGPYELRGIIGEGAFSIVRLACLDDDVHFFACKRSIHLVRDFISHVFLIKVRCNGDSYGPDFINPSVYYQTVRISIKVGVIMRIAVVIEENFQP
jgi:hypothetical protein